MARIVRTVSSHIFSHEGVLYESRETESDGIFKTILSGENGYGVALARNDMHSIREGLDKLKENDGKLGPGG